VRQLPLLSTPSPVSLPPSERGFTLLAVTRAPQGRPLPACSHSLQLLSCQPLKPLQDLPGRALLAEGAYHPNRHLLLTRQVMTLAQGTSVTVLAGVSPEGRVRLSVLDTPGAKELDWGEAYEEVACVGGGEGGGGRLLLPGLFLPAGRYLLQLQLEPGSAPAALLGGAPPLAALATAAGPDAKQGKPGGCKAPGAAPGGAKPATSAAGGQQQEGLGGLRWSLAVLPAAEERVDLRSVCQLSKDDSLERHYRRCLDGVDEVSGCLGLPALAALAGKAAPPGGGGGKGAAPKPAPAAGLAAAPAAVAAAAAAAAAAARPKPQAVYDKYVADLAQAVEAPSAAPRGGRGSPLAGQAPAAPAKALAPGARPGSSRVAALGAGPGPRPDSTPRQAQQVGAAPAPCAIWAPPSRLAAVRRPLLPRPPSPLPAPGRDGPGCDKPPCASPAGRRAPPSVAPPGEAAQSPGSQEPCRHGPARWS
jgi:hypothetical protein